MEHIIFFHDHSITLIIFIISLILFILIKLSWKFSSFTKSIKREIIEIIWTIIPIFILILLAIPSIKILYLFEEEFSYPIISIKILGNQWFWSYEYPEFNNISFDSYINKILMPPIFSFLDTDTRIIIPYKIHTRLLIRSKDVIHSWSIPNLGIKIDAIPGRINQTNIFPNRPGIFFGNCIEICGENHSSIPITLEVTNIKNFSWWLKNI